MIILDIESIDFDKVGGLIPVIAQDDNTYKVLMLGYANREALEISKKTKKLTFYSRTKKRIWTKGEESRNFLHIVSLTLDCDQDTILAKVRPSGPVCHTGEDTCWGEKNQNESIGFLGELEQIIQERSRRFNVESSYIATLLSKGINKVAQKVGEEAVELVIESKDNNKDLFLGEGADLLFHILILLHAKGFKLEDVVQVLKSRQKG